MKFDREKAFPYPVLRPYSDDYTQGSFLADVDFVLSQSDIVANVTFALSNTEILRELERGHATYVAVISCRDTFFQAVLKASSPAGSLTIQANALRGLVSVDFYVVACKNIPSFVSQHINSEFGATPIAFTVGDVLAQALPKAVYIDRDLFRPLTSLVDLVKDEGLTGGSWRVDLDEDHLKIAVSPSMKAAIDSARDGRENQIILINSLYFSAIVQALQTLKDSPDHYQDVRWAVVVQMQLHNAGVDLMTSDAYLVAQQLLKRPLEMIESQIWRRGE